MSAQTYRDADGRTRIKTDEATELKRYFDAHMAMTHTPGPWKAIFRGAGGWAICNPTWTEYLRDSRVTKFDARLMAASPRLLETLRQCVAAWYSDEFPSDPTMDEACKAAKNLIAEIERP